MRRLASRREARATVPLRRGRRWKESGNGEVVKREEASGNVAYWWASGVLLPLAEVLFSQRRWSLTWSDFKPRFGD